MQILHYCSSIDIKYGGPSRSVVLLCNQLSFSRNKVYLFSRFQESIEINNKVNIVNFYAEGFIGRIILFCQYLFFKANRIDTVHIHGIWDLYHVILMLFCLFKKIPYFVQPRGMLEPWSLKQRRILKFIIFNVIEKPLLRFSKGIITTSELEKYNITKLQINVPLFLLPNGPYLPNIKQTTQKQKYRRLKRILFFSRIHEKKGIEVLISAFSKLIKDYPEMQLTIAGNGQTNYVNYIASLIKICSSNIRYIGKVLDHDKVKLYNDHDFFVLPTYSENFGIVLLEAITCGLPLLTTKESSWTEIEKDNLGFLIEANEKSILKGLKKVIKLQPSEYRNLCNNCKKYAKDFDWVCISQKALQIYNINEK